VEKQKKNFILGNNKKTPIKQKALSSASSENLKGVIDKFFDS